MTEIDYIKGSEELLSKVEPLWADLNNQHAQQSVHFKDVFLENTFENRKRQLLEKSKRGGLYIVVAELSSDKKAVAYCIGSLSKDENGNKAGEIDSIYVQEKIRGQGIGERLVRMALEWFREKDVTCIKTNVAVGNEEAISFYEKFSLYPRSVNLENQI